MEELIKAHQLELAKEAGLSPQKAATFEVFFPYNPKIIAAVAEQRLAELAKKDPAAIKEDPKETHMLNYARTFLDGKPSHARLVSEISAFLDVHKPTSVEDQRSSTRPFSTPKKDVFNWYTRN